MKRVLKITGKILRGTLRFILDFLEDILDSSSKSKKYEPTLNDIAYGEKMPFSDKYYIPDEKSRPNT